MSDTASKKQGKDLVLEYELDAPPEKVWRAISIPAFRERWLPAGKPTEAAPIPTAAEGEICIEMRDDEPPFLESIATFQIRPNSQGGTTLRIVHRLVDIPVAPTVPPAANSNGLRLMRAA
ncbi:polyketide cyclase [Shinella kummerowiae]|jgi:uncharacterized protein YndB with AHSA1/START domain|uniref:Polyketide cyclase n=1 Tax=Shinella kummerowiae TaxID=417745 RepID=A0A6N8SI14_9HYPH|nr:SRPBCC domain-containing protein [Shinella kummerowiae]MXN48153.1 polyketide cyclase [Shinella kummerowiae]